MSLNFALASFCRVHVGSLIRSSMRRSENIFTHRQTEVLSGHSWVALATAGCKIYSVVLEYKT